MSPDIIHFLDSTDVKNSSTVAVSSIRQIALAFSGKRAQMRTVVRRFSGHWNGWGRNTQSWSRKLKLYWIRIKIFCFHCRTTFTDGVSCQATRRSEIGEKLPTATRRSEIGEAVRFIGGQRESRRLHRVAAAGRRAVGPGLNWRTPGAVDVWCNAEATCLSM